MAETRLDARWRGDTQPAAEMKLAEEMKGCPPAVLMEAEARWRGVLAEETQRRAADDETLSWRMGEIESSIKAARDEMRGETAGLTERLGGLSKGLGTAVSELLSRDTTTAEQNAYFRTQLQTQLHGANLEAHSNMKQEINGTQQAIASLSEIVRSEMQVREELVGGCSEAIRRLSEKTRSDQEVVEQSLEMLFERMKKLEDETHMKVQLVDQTVSSVVEAFRRDSTLAGRLSPPPSSGLLKVGSTLTVAPLRSESSSVTEKEPADTAGDALWMAEFEGKIERLLANTEEAAAATQRLVFLEQKVEQLMGNAEIELGVLERTAAGFANSTAEMAEDLQRERTAREEANAQMEADIARLAADHQEKGVQQSNAAAEQGTVQALLQLTEQQNAEKARAQAAHRELTQAVARARDAVSSEVASRRNEIAAVSRRIDDSLEVQRQSEQMLRQQVSGLGAAIRMGGLPWNEADMIQVAADPAKAGARLRLSDLAGGCPSPSSDSPTLMLRDGIVVRSMSSTPASSPTGELKLQPLPQPQQASQPRISPITVQVEAALRPVR